MAEPDESAPLCQPPLHVELNQLGKHLGVRRFHVGVVFAGLILLVLPACIIGPVPYVLQEIQEDYGVDGASVALVSSGLLFGSILGVMGMGWLSDAIGRWTTVLVCVVWAMLVSLLHLGVEVSHGFGALVAIRFVLGIAFGGMATVILPYVMEFCSDDIRGSLSLCTSVGWSAGGVLSIFIVQVTRPEWKLSLASPALVGLFASVGLCFLPESFRWLFVSGRPDAAQETLNIIFRSQPCWKTAYVGDAPIVSKSDQECVSCGERVQKQFPELFTAAHRLATLEGVLLYMCCAGSSYASGIWGPVILQRAAGVERVPLWVFLIFEAASLTGTLLTIAAIDVIGRRPLIQGSFLVGTLTVLALLARPSLEVVVAVWIVLQVAQACMWASMKVHLGEVFPTSITGTGNGFAALWGRLMAGIAPIVVGAMLDRSLDLALFFIASITLLGFLVATALSQETMGRKIPEY